MHNTTKYINVIDALVENYNTSYHSGIKMIHDDVESNDEKVIKLTTKNITWLHKKKQYSI